MRVGSAGSDDGFLEELTAEEQAELDDPNSPINRLLAEEQAKLDDPNSPINRLLAEEQAELDDPNSPINRLLAEDRARLNELNIDLSYPTTLGVFIAPVEAGPIPEPDPSLTARDVAVWMLQQVETQNLLYQHVAASYIFRYFGERFTYRNHNGNLAISPNVLSEFRLLSRDTVVWSRRERYWRYRLPSDPEGRAVE